MPLTPLQTEAMEAAHQGISALPLLNRQLTFYLKKDLELQVEGTSNGDSLLGAGAAENYFLLKRAVYTLECLAVHGLNRGDKVKNDASLPKAEVVDIDQLIRWGRKNLSTIVTYDENGRHEIEVEKIRSFARKHSEVLEKIACDELVESLKAAKFRPEEIKKKLAEFKESLKGEGRMFG